MMCYHCAREIPEGKGYKYKVAAGTYWFCNLKCWWDWQQEKARKTRNR